MRKLILAAGLICGAVPVAADEFTDVVRGALEAYEAGEIDVTHEDLTYALTLLQDAKAASLANHLPAALPGWTRVTGEADAAGNRALGMFGGGVTAAADYLNPSGDLSITLVAESPMVASISAMMSSLGAIGGGKPVRIQRVRFMDDGGELQGVVDDRILVTVEGEASLESKKAYLEAMDFKALARF